jgi:methyl-galactoside transport system permease protein
MIVLMGTLIVINPALLSRNNISYILSQASPRLILALAIGGIIVLGGTDLAAGRMIGMVGLICATVLQAPDYSLRLYPNLPRLPLFVPLLFSMVICCIFTIGHALLVAKLKIAPFIASLGLSLVVYGVASIYGNKINNMAPTAGLDSRYTNFAQGAITVFGFRVAYVLIYAAIVTFIVWMIWNKTPLGKMMYAVGGNAEAAIVSGINVTKIFILIYILAGILYAFSGFLEAARTGSANSNLGADYALDGIAACVVGGVSMRGGIGKVSGVIAGVMIFQMISYGLVFIGTDIYLQFVVKGLIIIFAIAIDTQKYIKKR